MKDSRRIICIHGYGVRGFFWTPIKLHLEEYFTEVITPDLKMEDIPSAITEVRELAKIHSRESGQPVILFGHSLGGILCAMAAKDLEKHELHSLIVMASPYGRRKKGIHPLVKFMLKHRLIPGWAVRSQFFGKHTPVHLQKELFNNAVPENLSIQEAVAEPTWFHSEEVKRPFGFPVLGLASEADKIVSGRETQLFTEALGGLFYSFPENLQIGHDDFTVHEPAIQQLLRVLLPFLGKNYELPLPKDALLLTEDGDDFERQLMMDL
ncbi:alpha/beta fold hydrolase [Salinispira pacifica]|uniref:AB hydrolase-1 domain-containing protein n=1 Tax=Salinispira pacifica TaxID=1307761 RepID=V5WGD2_9SPIO|nr:alpha/beta fold hydrolase [Salinispira pacifica]AHC14680.1 hypothetical protein L21SP2_1279 [Salinispira pacifica]